MITSEPKIGILPKPTNILYLTMENKTVNVKKHIINLTFMNVANSTQANFRTGC